MRSTTQRRGSTVKPFVPGGLLTTSTRRPSALRGLGHQRLLVAPVAPDELQVRGPGFGLGQYRARANRVCTETACTCTARPSVPTTICRFQSASHLLARIVAVTAPLLAPVRTDCVSMAPAVGSAARFGWRTALRSPSISQSQVPSSRHASNCL